MSNREHELDYKDCGEEQSDRINILFISSKFSM